uniref:Methylosome subunit pICln n=1 Tax=Colobus angolensis palliatus TaxID=336983 RepID=A0A2K5HSX2_COLAP
MAFLLVEGHLWQQPDTKAVLNRKGLRTGTLYIAESLLSWLDGSGLGFSLEYPTISLHALSRDRPDCLGEHLYVTVNDKFEESKESVADEEEDIVSSDKSALEAMFTAMCECQALHPDPEDEDSDDYDGKNMMWKHMNEDKGTSLHFTPMKMDYSINNGMEVDITPTVAGQFEDADVDH